jgi:hypothetical protein
MTTTGFVQRFQGKVKIGELFLDLFKNKSIYDSYTGVLAGSPIIAQKKTVQATADASGAFAWAVPPGLTLLRATVFTTVAFLGSTTVTLALGTQAGDNTYVTATDVKAVGTHPLTLNSGATVTADCLAMPALASGSNLFGTLAQGGTPSATGTATLLLEFA